MGARSGDNPTFSTLDLGIPQRISSGLFVTSSVSHYVPPLGPHEGLSEMIENLFVVGNT